MVQEAVAVNCTVLSSHNIQTWIDASINDKQIKVEELKSNLSIGSKNEDMLQTACNQTKDLPPSQKQKTDLPAPCELEELARFKAPLVFFPPSGEGAD